MFSEKYKRLALHIAGRYALPILDFENSMEPRKRTTSHYGILAKLKDSGLNCESEMTRIQESNRFMPQRLQQVKRHEELELERQKQNTHIFCELIREGRIIEASEFPTRRRRILLDEIDQDGNTLLHVVSAPSDVRGYFKNEYDDLLRLLRWLLKHRSIDLNAKNHAGKTAAHIAAENNNRYTFDCLVAWGASAFIRTDDGRCVSDLTKDPWIIDKVYYPLRNCLRQACIDKDSKNIKHWCKELVNYKVADRLHDDDDFFEDATSSLEAATVLAETGIEWESRQLRKETMLFLTLCYWDCMIDFAKASTMKKQWQKIMSEDEFLTQQITTIVLDTTQIFKDLAFIVNAYLENDLLPPLKEAWDVKDVETNYRDTISIVFGAWERCKYVSGNKTHPLYNFIKKRGAIEKAYSCSEKVRQLLFGSSRIDFRLENKAQCEALYKELRLLV